MLHFLFNTKLFFIIGIAGSPRTQLCGILCLCGLVAMLLGSLTCQSRVVLGFYLTKVWVSVGRLHVSIAYLAKYFQIELRALRLRAQIDLRSKAWRLENLADATFKSWAVALCFAPYDVDGHRMCPLMDD